MKHAFRSIAFILLLAAAGCGSAEDAELSRASSVIFWMSAPMNLSRSQFCAAYPDCRASEFVSYIFSPMGTSEWPDSDELAESDPTIREQAEAVRMPLWPRNVAAVSRNPDPARGKQIVVKYDDARNAVIVEGYTDPAKEPVLVKEYPIEKVTPAPGIREIFESNVEAGISYRSF